MMERDIERRMKSGKYFIDRDYLSRGRLSDVLYSTKYPDIHLEVIDAFLLLSGNMEEEVMKLMDQIDLMVEEREHQEKWTSEW